MNRVTSIYLAICGITLLIVSPLQAGQAADPHGGGHGASMRGQHMGTVDLNSASTDELRQLPGLTEASVRKIVENRPYARPDELVTKKVLSASVYDGIKDHVAASKTGRK